MQRPKGLKGILDKAVAWVERTPRRRRVVSRAMARYYRARGAHPVIVTDALDQAAEIPLPATRSTMRWASALAGGASMPNGFRPDRRLISPEARRVGMTVLEEAIQRSDDPQLGRHRSYLLRDRGPDDPELRNFVLSALEKRLGERSLAAPPGKALDPKAGFEVLCVLDDLLSGAGMRPFLVSGTLLGVVREGGLLEQDYDLDIGLLPGDGTAEEVAELLSSINGVVLYSEKWRVWGTHPSGVAFDVFLHYEERGRYYHATRTHAWWNSPFELVQADLDGRQFWIPDDVDTYFGENYGDWHSPIAFYHKSFDTPNREYVNSADALLYLYELIVNSSNPLTRGDRFVCESATRELAHNFGIDLTHHFASSALLAPEADVSLDRPADLERGLSCE